MKTDRFRIIETENRKIIIDKETNSITAIMISKGETNGKTYVISLL